MRQLLNLPNLFSLARLGLTPFVVWSLLGGNFRQALALFTAAGVTDTFDGLLARKYGWSTRIGAYLDPISDKVLLAAVYLSLGIAGAVPWWLVAIVFGRDVLILTIAGAFFLFTSHRDFSPSLWGKISTIVQVLTAVAAIARRAFPVPVLEQATSILVAAAAAGTLWSGVNYAWRGSQMLRNASAAQQD